MFVDARSSKPPWHALFAPLPLGIVPERKPIATPEILATPEGAEVVGWVQLIVRFSAGCAGLRNLSVLLDGNGRVLSASDHVLFRSEIYENQQALVVHEQENVGGSFDENDEFRGARWRATTVETIDGHQVKNWRVAVDIGPDDSANLRCLVNEILRRSQSS